MGNLDCMGNLTRVVISAGADCHWIVATWRSTVTGGRRCDISDNSEESDNPSLRTIGRGYLSASAIKLLKQLK